MQAKIKIIPIIPSAGAKKSARKLKTPYSLSLPPSACKEKQKGGQTSGGEIARTHFACISKSIL